MAKEHVTVATINLRIFAFIIFIQFYSCTSTQSLPDSIRQIQFSTIGSIPIIEGKINGKRAIFIIDTGASVSLLNEARYKHFGFNFYNNSDKRAVGFGGSSHINEAFNCHVELGELKISKIAFRTRNMDDFTKVINQHENIEVAGIIGSDVFLQYNIRIDYKNRTISF